MGKSKLWASENRDTRVRVDNDNNSRIVADKYEFEDESKHGHRSYDLNRDSGEYKEYSGGPNSDDRNYNK